MNSKVICALSIWFAGATLVSVARGEEISLDSARPVVIRSMPEPGNDSVDPALTEIRVTFSKDMQPGSWSWCLINKETYPGTSDAPRFLDDKRTCVLPVKLQPGKTYAVWINSEKFHDFKDSRGLLAVPYLLVFKTRN
jgi:Bacterial Ig-like domain